MLIIVKMPTIVGILTFMSMINFVLFVWFDFLRPINNLSVIKGRVFLGWTSTKLGQVAQSIDCATWLGLMFLLKDTAELSMKKVS